MQKKNYLIYSISNRELSKAGDILRKDPNSIESLEILEKWRAMHAYPLNTFQANIRNILKKLKIENGIVAQRLKRLQSILLKLNRFSSMKLYRMQDIGGLRIILNDIVDVYKVCNSIKASRWKHKLHNTKDYIQTPAPSGYRSVHLIYEYDNILAPIEYKGMHIEIQIRTKLQHIWATAVETIGTFINHSLKSSQGPDEWLEYLKLASVVFALEENTSIADEYKDKNKNALIKELHLKTSNLRAFELLNTFHATVKFSEKLKFKNKYILLRLNLEEHIATAQVFDQNKLTDATMEYSKIEREMNASENAVLVASSTLKDLRKAYPNYFIDASEFIKYINKIFKENGLTQISTKA